MKNKQIIFDDPVFFEGYKNLRQNDTGLNGVLEIPAIRKLIPNLNDKTILDLGSGFGDFARYAAGKGAKSITGIEVSKKMLDEAVRLTTDNRIKYLNTSIENLKLEPDNYDLIISSLALHYVCDFNEVCQKVYSALKSDGHFIFSVEHPICTASSMGWIKIEEKPYWPISNYHDESIRKTTWFVDNVMKYHRSTETYINTLIDCGFTIRALKEPSPLPEAIKERPKLSLHNLRPPFLIISAKK